MNKKLFTFLFLLSGPAQAGSLPLGRGDFRSAETITRDGHTLVRVKLSKSGKAKLRRLNRSAAGEAVAVRKEINGR